MSRRPSLWRTGHVRLLDVQAVQVTADHGLLIMLIILSSMLLIIGLSGKGEEKRPGRRVTSRVSPQAVYL